MALQNKKIKDVNEVIKELTTLNKKIERLLEQVPTSDSNILSQLDSLYNTLPRILNAKVSAEKGTILYEQAVGKAISLKERYTYKLIHGGLRKIIR